MITNSSDRRRMVVGRKECGGHGEEKGAGREVSVHSAPGCVARDVPNPQDIYVCVQSVSLSLGVSLRFFSVIVFDFPVGYDMTDTFT